MHIKISRLVASLQTSHQHAVFALLVAQANKLACSKLVGQVANKFGTCKLVSLLIFISDLLQDRSNNPIRS